VPQAPTAATVVLYITGYGRRAAYRLSPQDTG